MVVQPPAHVHATTVACASGANVFGHLKDLAAQALTMGAIVPRSTEQEVVEEEEKKVVEHISTQDVEDAQLRRVLSSQPREIGCTQRLRP